MKKNPPKELHRTRIGGQALMEGVMMHGIDKMSMAVRLPSGEIDVETWGFHRNSKRFLKFQSFAAFLIWLILWS